MTGETELMEGGNPLPPPVPGEGVTCPNCAAFRVCRVFAGIAPLMEDFGDEPPMDIRRLAELCDVFAPVRPITVNFVPALPVDTTEEPDPMEDLL